jgi:hypothetical protein
MKQSLPVTSIIVAGVGASALWWFSSKPNRLKAQSSLRDWKHKFKPSPFHKSETLPIEKGGIPHPHDFEDTKMVDEGALYSVRFYNEKMQ